MNILFDKLKEELHFLGVLCILILAMMFAKIGEVRSAEWNNNATADWNVDGSWTNPVTFPNAIDAIADFSKLDINANRTISLEADITIGHMLLGDPSGTSRYTIQNGSSGNLTFDVSSGRASIRQLSATGTNYLDATVLMNSPLDIINESTSTLYVRSPINNIGNDLKFSGNGTISNSNQATAIFSGAGNIIIDGVYFDIRGPTHAYTGNLILINGGSVMEFSNNLGPGPFLIYDGVFKMYWGGSLTRTLGTGAGQVAFLGGIGGFSGQGATGSSMTLNNNASFEVVWGSAHFKPDVLVLQSDTANQSGDSTFNNDIDLNGAFRTVTNLKVNNADDGFARMTGDIRTSSGTAGLIKTGPGVLRLSGSNSYNGGTVINAGILEFESSGAIGGSGRNVFVATGANVATRYAMDNAFLNRMVESSNVFSVCLGLNSSNDLDFNSNTGATLPNAILGTRGNRTYDGTITPNNSTYRLGGGHYGVLTVSSTLGGSNGLVVYGDVTLTGTISYSQNTDVMAGTLIMNSINTNNSVSTMTIAATGATVNLNFTGTTTLQSLYIGATEQNAGIYGAGGNALAQITGTGNVLVTGSLSPPGTIIQLR